MEYEIYIDIFFLTDCFLNILSLLLTVTFLKKERKWIRICLAAGLGGIWNCFLLLVPLFSSKEELVISIFFTGSIMMWMILRNQEYQPNERKTWGKSLLKADLVLFFSAALVNGCMEFSREHFFLSDLECLSFTGCITFVLICLLKELMKKRKIGSERYRVRLYFRGNVREFYALADSGNRLRVPENGKSVTVISYRDCIGFCDSVSEGFYIPYRAVGTREGLLFATFFEKMEIIYGSKNKIIEKPAVAISKDMLSVNGEFSMLLPEEYILED